MKYLNYTVTGRALSPVQKAQRKADRIGLLIVAGFVVAFTVWAVGVQIEDMAPKRKALVIETCTTQAGGGYVCVPAKR